MGVIILLARPPYTTTSQSKGPRARVCLSSLAAAACCLPPARLRCVALPLPSRRVAVAAACRRALLPCLSGRLVREAAAAAGLVAACRRREPGGRAFERARALESKGLVRRGIGTCQAEEFEKFQVVYGPSPCVLVAHHAFPCARVVVVFVVARAACNRSERSKDQRRQQLNRG